MGKVVDYEGLKKMLNALIVESAKEMRHNYGDDLAQHEERCYRARCELLVLKKVRKWIRLNNTDN
jgi:hypothetical protein